MNIAVGMFSSQIQTKNRRLASIDASKITSIPYVVIVFLSLLIGPLTDKFGNRPIILLVSCLIGIIGLIFIIYRNTVIAMINLGFFYSFFANIIWSSLPLVVKKNQFVKNNFILFYFRKLVMGFVFL